MRFFLRLFMSVSIIVCATNTLAKPIIVVTNDAYSISNVPAEARVINLDRAEQLHEQLSVNLPDNLGQATKIAKERLATSGNQLQQALQDIVDAWALGIFKVPAVLIGNKVVYGVSDINRAISLIKGYEEQSK